MTNRLKQSLLSGTVVSVAHAVRNIQLAYSRPEDLSFWTRVTDWLPSSSFFESQWLRGSNGALDLSARTSRTANRIDQRVQVVVSYPGCQRGIRRGLGRLS